MKFLVVKTLVRAVGSDIILIVLCNNIQHSGLRALISMMRWQTLVNLNHYLNRHNRNTNNYKQDSHLMGGTQKKMSSKKFYSNLYNNLMAQKGYPQHLSPWSQTIYSRWYNKRIVPQWDKLTVILDVCNCLLMMNKVSSNYYYNSSRKCSRNGLNRSRMLVNMLSSNRNCNINVIVMKFTANRLPWNRSNYYMII